MRIRDVGEVRLIETLTRSLKYGRGVIAGVGDDAAVLAWTARQDMLFTSDILIEGVHFTRRQATPFQVGWKALSRATSDIAAMGGVPRYALISAALPPHTDVRYVRGIYKGLQAAAHRFGIAIVGGDTAHDDHLTIDVAMIGTVAKGKAVYRSGAHIGDLILVTGTIGGSRHRKHLEFVPRVREARALTARFHLTAMIDVSDGLALDLGRILRASNVGARLYENLIPLSSAAGTVAQAIADGEDFELLFTMPPAEARRLCRRFLPRTQTPVTIIGEIVAASEGYRIIADDGSVRSYMPKGYTHF